LRNRRNLQEVSTKLPPNSHSHAMDRKARRPDIGAFEAIAAAPRKTITNSVTATSIHVKVNRYEAVTPPSRGATSIVPVEIGPRTFQFETDLKGPPLNRISLDSR